jgi:S1-C subfamily serine protease
MDETDKPERSDEPDDLVASTDGPGAVASNRAQNQRRAVVGAALVVGMAVGGAGTAAALNRPSSTSTATPAADPVISPVEAPQWPGLSTSDPSSSGVVTIAALVSDGRSQGVAAGTGMVLTAGGIVLTNNHVIEGASAIEVTDPSTGATYNASLVASDVRADVAVLQLDSASDLPTVTLDDDSGAVVGSSVTAVGNAEGEGALVSSSGTVLALNQTVTTTTESVDGLFAFSAVVVPGDSGGPVYDDEGEVVGMTTAMATDGVRTVAYAITISDALAVASSLGPSLPVSGVV